MLFTQNVIILHIYCAESEKGFYLVCRQYIAEVTEHNFYAAKVQNQSTKVRTGFY